MLEALTTGLAQEITARTPDDVTATPNSQKDYINDIEWLIIITRTTDYRIKDIELNLLLNDTTVTITTREWQRDIEIDLNHPESIETAIKGILKLIKGII